MSEQSTTNIEQSSSGVARGSAKPQQGEPVAHPGRGGQNVYIQDKSASSHARGAGNSLEKTQDSDVGGFARGGGKAQQGEPVPHPGRGGQNVYIEDEPSVNHPRGSGSPSSTTSEPQSANDFGLDTTQLSVVAARINEVISNQDSLKQPAAEI